MWIAFPRKRNSVPTYCLLPHTHLLKGGTYHTPLVSLDPSNTPGNLDITTPVSDDHRDPSAPPTPPVPPHPPLFDLPTFHPATDPTFVWGNHNSINFCNSLKDAYREVVHWRKNCFKVPLGNVGKSFVSELARLYNSFASGSALESIALMATIVLPILVLQIPYRRSKVKDHIACLERRLKAWKDGDIEILVEGRTLQPIKVNSQHSGNLLARSFADLMFKGKTHAALDLLANGGKGGVLRLEQLVMTNSTNTQSVRDILKSKHPASQPATTGSTLQGVPPEIHPVIIDSRLIRSTALKTSGTAGPSGLDAHAWRRLCTSFKSSSDTLFLALAELAKRLCSSLIDPQLTSPILACRLIALYKCPGVRPIGIGDTARRIISKAVLAITRGDIQEATGSFQLCAGQISGCEAAVHSVRECFLEDDTQAALLVDASNAFNSGNRLSALHNIRHLCPSIATILINTYRAPTELFIDGDVIYSKEGTTQGEPLAMPMYALATVPLIKKLSSSVKQTWYADDAAATGRIESLTVWWDEIKSHGPSFGYHANASKTWIIVKEKFMSKATTVFGDTRVNITSDGRPYLGAALGSPDYVEGFVNKKVTEWSRS